MAGCTCKCSKLDFFNCRVKCRDCSLSRHDVYLRNTKATLMDDSTDLNYTTITTDAPPTTRSQDQSTYWVPGAPNGSGNLRGSAVGLGALEPNQLRPDYNHIPPLHASYEETLSLLSQSLEITDDAPLVAQIRQALYWYAFRDVCGGQPGLRDFKIGPVLSSMTTPNRHHHAGVAIGAAYRGVEVPVLYEMDNESLYITHTVHPITASCIQTEINVEVTPGYKLQLSFPLSGINFDCHQSSDEHSDCYRILGVPTFNSQLNYHRLETILSSPLSDISKVLLTAQLETTWDKAVDSNNKLSMVLTYLTKLLPHLRNRSLADQDTQIICDILNNSLDYVERIDETRVSHDKIFASLQENKKAAEILISDSEKYAAFLYTRPDASLEFMINHIWVPDSKMRSVDFKVLDHDICGINWFILKCHVILASLYHRQPPGLVGWVIRRVALIVLNVAALFHAVAGAFQLVAGVCLMLTSILKIFELLATRDAQPMQRFKDGGRLFLNGLEHVGLVLPSFIHSVIAQGPTIALGRECNPMESLWFSRCVAFVVGFFSIVGVIPGVASALTLGSLPAWLTKMCNGTFIAGMMTLLSSCVRTIQQLCAHPTPDKASEGPTCFGWLRCFNEGIDQGSIDEPLLAGEQDAGKCP